MIAILLMVSIFICGHFSKDTTLYPELSTMIPSGTFTTEDIRKCLNKYWDFKGDYEKEERQRWQCPDKCELKTQCCMAYKVYGKMEAIKIETVNECSSSTAKMAIKKFLPEALKKMNQECKQVYKSEECKKLEQELNADKGKEPSKPNEPNGDSGTDQPNPGLNPDPDPDDSNTDHAIGLHSQQLFGLILGFISICYTIYT